MKFTCTKCAVDLLPSKVGVSLVETFDTPSKPYKIWAADLFACPGCGFEIVMRSSYAPISEHWHKDFAERLARAPEPIYYSHEKVQQ